MSLVQVGNIVGALCSGILVDKIFNGKTKPVILSAFVLLMITTLSVKFPSVYDNKVLLGIVPFLTGSGITSIMLSISTFIATNFPGSIVGKIFASAFGISLIIGAIGLSIGSAALHFTGNYQLSIMNVSIVSLIGFFPAVFFYRPKRFSVRKAENIQV